MATRAAIWSARRACGRWMWRWPRQVSLTERLGLQFRVEAFNVFNRAQFGSPAGESFVAAQLWRDYDAGESRRDWKRNTTGVPIRVAVFVLGEARGAQMGWFRAVADQVSLTTTMHCT